MTTRRTLLARAAAALAGASGLAFGSGAFTRTKADRTFEIGLTGDDDAQLTIRAGDSGAASVAEDGTIQLDVSSVNTESTTTYADAITVSNENQTDQPVALYIPSIRDGSDEPAVSNIQNSVQFIADAQTAADRGSRDISQPPSTDGPTGAQVLAEQSDTENNAVGITIRVLDTLTEVEAGESVNLSLPIAAERLDAETISDVETEDLPNGNKWEDPEGGS